MSSLRRYLSLSAAALLSFASPALAEAPVDASAASGGEGETSSLFCHIALCDTDADCRAACSSAVTATCVANECQYTYSTGGGGPGGPFCAPKLCSDNSECECNGRWGYCGPNSECVY